LAQIFKQRNTTCYNYFSVVLLFSVLLSFGGFSAGLAFVDSFLSEGLEEFL